MLATRSSQASPSRIVYWVCQIIGWGMWCVAGLYIARQHIGSLNPAIITGYTLFFFYAIGFTHLLRWIIKIRGWLALPPGRALGVLAGSALVTGVLLTAFVVLVSFLQHGSASDFVRPASVAVLAVNLIFAASIWTTLSTAT